MYIIDDICYADSPETDIKIVSAKPLEGRMLLVKFSSGEIRLFDTTLLKGSAFAPLDEEEVFNSISIFHGIITWNNGEIDIAPETVYAQSYPYDTSDDVVAF